MYCTTEELKSHLNIEDVGADEGLLYSLGEAASEWIDDYCDREFGTTDETRYFDGAQVLFIDDLISVTTLKLDEDGDGTYEETLSESDYVLYPLNKTPKTRIEISSDSSYGSFAAGIKKGVEIEGTWGYQSTIPDVIRMATIIQACRWFKRKDTAFSTTLGSPEETGVVETYQELDPDVKMILEKYRRIRC